MTQHSDEPTDAARSQLLRLGSAFSPGAPINQPTLFAGRQQQLEAISDAVVQRGLHVVVFGERGVGKTSLTNVLPEFIEQAEIGDFSVARVNCDTDDTFETLWRKMLREVVVSIAKPSTGFIPAPQEEFATLDETLGSNVNPEEVRYLLQRIGSRLILVFDEFDRLTKPGADRTMADVIKSLSDHSVDATVVVVGVADTVDDLIREHHSIDRCLVQVRMPLMSMQELTDILQNGYSQVGMRIQPDAADMIAFLSEGLPHFTHSLGLEAGRAALLRRSATVAEEDARTGLDRALSQTQHSVVADFTKAISSQRRDAMFLQALLACALARTDPLGYFAAPDVRTHLSRVMGKRYEIPAFARHLDQFCQAARGPALQRSGTPRRYRYRFVNPMLRAYVIMYAVNKGLYLLTG